MEKENDVNLITLGDSGVGKTCIINRFTGGTFNIEHNSTVGSGLIHKEVNIDSQKVKLKIWDTAGQEKYDSITKLYFQRANGAFIVFDLTSRISFQKAQKWINSLKECGNGHTRMVLIGNKYDLDENRTVNNDEATLLAYENEHIPYFETSAKTGFNIEESFMCLSKEALIAKNESEKPQTLPIEEGGEEGGKGCKC